MLAQGTAKHVRGRGSIDVERLRTEVRGTSFITLYYMYSTIAMPWEMGYTGLEGAKTVVLVAQSPPKRLRLDPYHANFLRQNYMCPRAKLWGLTKRSRAYTRSLRSVEMYMSRLFAKGRGYVLAGEVTFPVHVLPARAR